MSALRFKMKHMQIQTNRFARKYRLEFKTIVSKGCKIHIYYAL